MKNPNDLALYYVNSKITKSVTSLPLYEEDEEILYEILEPKSNEFTHNIYKFPTKFVPEVPRWALRKFSRGNNFTVMDPFCGSGTTLVESSLMSKFSIGIDINPFCQLLSKVKTTPFNSTQFKESELLFGKIVSTLKRSKLSLDDVDAPDLPNINHWFEEKTIKDLALIRNCIAEYVNEGGSTDIADFFKVCLACIIKKVSLADEQSPKPYVSRRFAKEPKPVLDEFVHAYMESLKSLKEFSSRVKKSYSYVPPEGDARKLFTPSIESFMEEKSLDGVDLMITSPPYINAYDLVRTFKLELFWLDLIAVKEVKNLKERHIGTEEVPQVLYKNGKAPKTGHSDLDEIMEKIYEVDEKRAFIVWKFFVDMETHLKQAFDLLLPGGHYVIVIGDSVIRGNKICTSKILSDIGRKIGFKEVERLSYIIKNHYLRIPRGNRGGKVQVDHISVLRKP